MPKTVSDEKLLEMLLVHGGVGGAATALGLSRNAIYKRLRDDAFRQQYDALQGVLLGVAASTMCDGLTDAVSALLEVIRDKNAAATVRISAADSLLRHCAKYIETASVLRRLDALEAAQNNS